MRIRLKKHAMERDDFRVFVPYPATIYEVRGLDLKHERMRSSLVVRLHLAQVAPEDSVMMPTVASRRHSLRLPAFGKRSLRSFARHCLRHSEAIVVTEMLGDGDAYSSTPRERERDSV